ncbi:MAG: dihydrofolate reductase, partial [Anaerolineales bacterium]
TIIVTRDQSFQPEGCLVAHSLETALEFARLDLEDNVFVIGGAEIFVQAIELADRIYLTQVHSSLPADVYFPEFAAADWLETDSEYHPADEKNRYPFTFKILDRVN